MPLENILFEDVSQLVIFFLLCCPNGRESVLFSRGKPAATESRYPTLINYQHIVHAVFSCDHTTGCEAYSFTTDGYGIFNVHTNLDCVSYTVRKGIMQAQSRNSAQELLSRRARQIVPHPTPPRSRTQSLRKQGQPAFKETNQN